MTLSTEPKPHVSSSEDVGAGHDDMTVFFDPLSFTAYEHPFELYRRLRDRAPVYYNPRRDLWIVSRYRDVRACLRNHTQLVNALGNDMDGTHDSYGPGNLIALDGPHHAVLRALVGPAFSGRQIRTLESGIREAARELVPAFRARGGGDFAQDVALPLVFRVALAFEGIPVSEAPFWQQHLLRSMARTVGRLGIPADAAVSNHEAESHLAEVIASRRAELDGRTAPGDPALITRLVVAGNEGILDESEQVGLAHLILSAATDAPAALLTTCVAILDRYPELQRHLQRNPAKVGAFVEETFRYDPPGQNLCRQTVSPVTLAGVTIPEDSRVMVLLASANRDERVFEDPDSFRIDRRFAPDAKPLTFGDGVHACLGAPLARLVAQVAMEELVAALDQKTEVRVVGTPERWTKQMVRGFARLPIQFVSTEEGQYRLEPHASTAHLEEVRHLSARVTLATRELETEVAVESKELVAADVAALTLRSLDASPLPRWEPGAHIDLIIDGVATRQYSLSGDPADQHRFRLGILRDPAGSGGSLYVHDRLAVGDVVRVQGPRNNFPLVASPRHLFIAGGIGITPILPMIRAAEAAGASWRLVYGGRRRASMAFLDELAHYGDRVEVCPQDEVGLLDLEALLGAPQPDTLVYCCGPEPLLAAVEERCATWPGKCLHVERFVARPLTEPVLKQPFEVELARSGLALTVPLEKSILDVIEEAGVGVRVSCREGTCGTCETGVVSGVPDHRDSVLGEDERAAGNSMMICVSRSSTPRLVLDL